MLNGIDGKKSYLVGAGWILFGIGGLVTKSMDTQTALTHIMTGFSIIAGRSALSKLNPK